MMQLRIQMMRADPAKQRTNRSGYFLLPLTRTQVKQTKPALHTDIYMKKDIGKKGSELYKFPFYSLCYTKLLLLLFFFFSLPK